MKCKILSVNIGLDPIATVTLATEDKPTLSGVFDDFNGVEADVTFKKYRHKRSAEANSYLWVLIGKIAFVTGQSKDDVYREFVRSYGRFCALTMERGAVESFAAVWKNNGVGWLTETIGGSRENPDMVDVIAYYGTSVYDTAEFSRIVDAVTEECKDLGIAYETGAFRALLESA